MRAETNHGILGADIGAPEDPILKIKSEYEKDPREGKLSLAVGELMGTDGVQYVPPSVNEAKESANRVFPGYQVPDLMTGWHGIPDFMIGVSEIVFGEETSQDLIGRKRMAAVSTVGGTQALSLFADAVRRELLKNDKTPRVILGDPPYPNHPNIFKGDGREPGFEIDMYPHLTPDGKFNMKETLDAIQTADHDTVVVFQAEPHNPTGINSKTHEEWEVLAQAMKESEATALLDLPYLGLDVGVREDGFIARVFVKAGIPTAIAVSFSKISGLYADRLGILLMPYRDEAIPRNTTRIFNGIVRQINSSPPRWAQEVMGGVFRNTELREQWIQQDLPEIANDLRRRRYILAQALPENIREVVQNGIGMYTTIPISKDGAGYLKERYAIYVVPMGEEKVRINIGGATIEQMREAAPAIAETYGLYHA